MKKTLFAIPVVAFAFALAVAPAFASTNTRTNHCCKKPIEKKCCKIELPKTSIESNNHGHITNDIQSFSNSGWNVIEGQMVTIKDKCGRVTTRPSSVEPTIETGTADSMAIVDNTAGKNTTEISGKLSGNVDVSSDNVAHINNLVYSDANSGYNRITTNGKIITGDAISTASVFNVVGENITTISE